MVKNKSINYWLFASLFGFLIPAVVWANYDPHTGRFLTRDPIGYANGVNLYEYVKSRPNRAIDPMGLCEFSDPECTVFIPCGDPYCPLMPIYEDMGRIGDSKHTKGWQDFQRLKERLKIQCFTCKGVDSQAQCKAEAEKIADAILNTWIQKYADKRYLWDDEGGTIRYHYIWGDYLFKGSHTCGGYYCYEWSEHFFKSLSNLGKLEYWSFDKNQADQYTVDEETGNKIKTSIFHSWLQIELTHSCCELRVVSVDDGFCKDGYIHEDNMDIWPPRSCYFPPKKEEGFTKPETTPPPPPTPKPTIPETDIPEVITK